MKKKTKTALALLTIIVLIASSAFFYVKGQLSAPNTNHKVIYELKANSSLETVLKDLEEAKIIRNALISTQYARLFKDVQLKQGKFELSSNSSLDALLDQLSNNTTYVDNKIVLYLPEGKWAIHYAKAIQTLTGIDYQAILNKWNDPEYVSKLREKYWFLKDITQSNHAKVLLEGYLSANTYFLEENMSIEEITEMILNQRLVELEPYKVQLSNRNLHEVFTKASLVQYEASKKEDQHKVAQVIENRINANQRLELSVTVCYSLYENLNDWKDCETNATIDSPFNTYLNSGLPPTPINNPTIDAIDAVLNPTPHDFYYFVADVCGDGSVYYSKTYEEHLEKVDTYLTKKGCIN